MNLGTHYPKTMDTRWQIFCWFKASIRPSIHILLLHISIQQFHDIGMKNWKQIKWKEYVQKISNVSPERFWYVVVSHGGIILLWQKLSLDEIHNGMKPLYLMDTSYVFVSVINYCNSGFLNSLKNLMKSPSWFNVYLVRFKSSRWLCQNFLAFLENYNHIKTFRKLRMHFMEIIL